MPNGIIKFERKVGRQVPGIWSTHALLNPEVRKLLSEYVPITVPMLLAYQHVRVNFPEGKSTPLLVSDFPDDLVPVASVLVNPRAKFSALNSFNPPLLGPNGYPTPQVKVAFDKVLETEILSDIPTDRKKIRNIEQFLLDGAIHWQSYSYLWDTVKEGKYSRFGGLRPWVLNSLVALGVGHVEEKKMLKHRGRPPKVFVPNDWGKILVRIIDADSRAQVTNEMREASRLRRLPSVVLRLNNYKALAQGYTSVGLQVPQELAEKISDLSDWEDDD